MPSKLSLIFAGEDLTATLLDGSTTPVRVRAMPVRHLARVLALADQEAELLDFVCLVPSAPEPAPHPQPPTLNPQLSAPSSDIAGWQPVPPGWADNLTDESHAKLYEAAKRLNFSRAATWAERQIAAKQFTAALALKAEETLRPMLQQIVSSLGSLSSPSTAPAPAPAPKS